jgi:hypothetical protein
VELKCWCGLDVTEVRVVVPHRMVWRSYLAREPSFLNEGNPVERTVCAKGHVCINGERATREALDRFERLWKAKGQVDHAEA